MSTLGWVFIFVASILIRQVARGRALDLPQDLSDAFQAFINGNYDDLSGALTRSGDTATPSSGEIIGEAVGQAVTSDVSTGLINAAQKSVNNSITYWAYKLGQAAVGYRFTSVGPKYYDCSGLMYRSVQHVGYSGPRFTTSTIGAMPGMHKLASTGMGISQVTPGDIVVWPGHHMGVVVGQNKFYSALNPRVGIAERPIEGFRSGSRVYYRFTPKG